MPTQIAPELKYEVAQHKLHPEAWREEHIDSQSGDGFVTIFSRPALRIVEERIERIWFVLAQAKVRSG